MLTYTLVSLILKKELSTLYCINLITKYNYRYIFTYVINNNHKIIIRK